MPKVYITHESLNFNYLPAEKFGDIQFLTNNDWSVHESSLANRSTLERIRQGLSGFTEDDYLLPSGSPVITGIAMAILHEKFDRIRVLKWSNHSREYTPIVVFFN